MICDTPVNRACRLLISLQASETASDHNSKLSPSSQRAIRDRISFRISLHLRRWPTAGLAITHLQHIKSFTQPESARGDSHTSQRRECNSLAQRSRRTLGTWCSVGMSVESTVLIDGRSCGVGEEMSGCSVPKWSWRSAALRVLVVAGLPRGAG